jgi:tRNA A-37 threonylcarbamoyl transferase component Bud32
VKEFVEGENLVEVIKRIISTNQTSREDAAVIRAAGREVAETHKLGVTIGDCKPENIIVTKEGKTYFIDLEQATRYENQAWDVAQFLYYSGHYVSPLSSADSAVSIAREYTSGYLEAGGKKEVVKRASSLRHTKLFGIFTPPQIILAISNVCKKMSGE